MSSWRPLDRSSAILPIATIALTFALTPAAGAGAAARQEGADADEAAGEGKAKCADAAYRQFDFWLGRWEVRDSDGTVLGSNHIQSILSGCALQEDWTGASGSRGRSLNMYDAASESWHQTWVDEQGQLLRLDGGLEEGSMVLSGEVLSRQQPGTTVLHRVTWEPLEDGRVRQHWEASRDDGETWGTLFEGFYSRRE